MSGARGQGGKHDPTRRAAALVRVSEVILAPKSIDMTATEIVSALYGAGADGVSYPSKSARAAGWRVDFYLRVHMFRARFWTDARKRPSLAIDHHVVRVQSHDGEVIPPGHHWDVYPPLCDAERRHHRLAIDNDLSHPYDGIVFVAGMLNIALRPDKQPRLL